MAAVAEKVKQIIVEQLGVDENQVEPSASFVDDLGADSLDIVELVRTLSITSKRKRSSLESGIPGCRRGGKRMFGAGCET